MRIAVDFYVFLGVHSTGLKLKKKIWVTFNTILKCNKHFQ